MNRPSRLDVFFDDELVGTIHDSSPLSFEYSPGWLGRLPPMPIAAIALTPDRQNTNAVQAFFENLLPEGELRHYISDQKKASSLFSLLHEVAGDTVGGFIILPSGQQPQAPSYESTSWEKLGSILSRTSAAAIDIKGNESRISLAGAQDKTSIAIFDDGIPMLPSGTSPSTHILKPDIRRLNKVWNSAANETMVMLAAAACGLPTAEVFYEPHTKACVVKRFDRFRRPDGNLGRLVQYDLCQLSGAVSDKKYEKEGGPGLATCADLIRRYSSQPAVDLRHFVSWIFFNLFTGNNDSHAKNLSMYRTASHGVTLTPFYDLMCTRIYPGLSRHFTFAIGGETMPGSINRDHVVEMARQLRMQPSFVLHAADELSQKIPEAMAEAYRTVSPSLPPSARILARRIEQYVVSTTRKMVTRILRTA